MGYGDGLRARVNGVINGYGGDHVAGPGLEETGQRFGGDGVMFRKIGDGDRSVGILHRDLVASDCLEGGCPFSGQEEVVALPRDVGRDAQRIALLEKGSLLPAVSAEGPYQKVSGVDVKKDIGRSVNEGRGHHRRRPALPFHGGRSFAEVLQASLEVVKGGVRNGDPIKDLGEGIGNGVEKAITVHLQARGNAA